MSNDNRPLPPDGLTYYQLLGISEDAPESDVQKAYRQLIKVYHPDQWDHWAADDIAQRLRTAYEVLTDPRARQRYNQVGHEEYTGVEPASFSDIQNWLDEVQEMVDIEKPATMDDVSEGEEGNIEIEDDFEASGESMSAEEIFDEMDEDLTPTSSWDEAQEEVISEEDDTTPDYVESKDVADIDDVGVGPAPAEEDEREPVELSHEEEVKERAETSGRARDPTEVVSTPRQQDVDKSDVTNPNAPDESDEGALPIYPADISDTLRQYLSDDVMSRAVRRAWISRLAALLVVIIAMTAVGELASRSGVSLLANIFPTLDVILGDATGGLMAITAATVLIYVADQLKTEKDTSRGMINTAATPSRFGAYMIFLNAVGLAGVSYALMNGANPINAITTLSSGVLPVGHWTSAPTTNGIITVVVTGALGLGFIFGIGAVTRYVWYYRYVEGYHMLPVLWDTILIVPVVATLWLYLTGDVSIAVPVAVGDALVQTAPEAMGLIGVEAESLSRGFVTLVAVSLPTLLGVTILVRRVIETVVRKILS